MIYIVNILLTKFYFCVVTHWHILFVFDHDVITSPYKKAFKLQNMAHQIQQ